jgi:NAD(P)H-dependent FMN reductase
VPRLNVIIASVREKRGGLAVADWFVNVARRHGGFDVELIDLEAVNLPLLNEPQHPRLQQYQHEHTKKWSEMVRRGDAYVFVTPEYNYGAPPALVNALDYVYVEWNYKAAGFVSYGGVSAGTRSVVMAKTIVTTLKMVPLVEAVQIPFYAQLIKDGVFDGGESHEKTAIAMLNELARWTDALKTLRA